MRALVVYESMFGNTRKIAEAVAEGLSGHAETDVAEVGAAAAPADDVGLIVVGGPTHAHGMSRPGTRQGAAKDAAQDLVTRGIGVREWLGSLPAARGAMAAAAFDTRFDKPAWLTGSASRGAARQLRRCGYRLVVPPESFFVQASSGPLAPEELDRARRWGQALGTALVAAAPGPANIEK
jgi:hypothetical protein